MFDWQVNRGAHDAEVLIFGSGDAQLKAKDMIEDLMHGNSVRGPGYRNGRRVPKSLRIQESVLFLLQC